MSKPDDSSLTPDQLRAVEARARAIMNKAAAWDRFPTPIEDILAAADLKVAPTSIFNPQQIIAYISKKAASAAQTVADTALTIKSAVSKVLGLYDSHESLIHIDTTVVVPKQNFLKLHETGHHEMPTHRKMFRLFQDCEKNLAPEIADLFEREANNFARIALFQGDGFARMAADEKLAIKVPMNLAKKFGASVYAGCREYARTNHRDCAVYVLERLEFCADTGVRGEVRRIEVSPSFEVRFGRPNDVYITADHLLGPILPFGRRMTKPTQLSIADRNGQAHECLAEAFDTTFNVIILLYPVKALTATTIILSAAE